MMSKNNVEEISKRASNHSGKYALRKLSVGVASVLIGTTMYVGLAHADTVPINNESTPIVQTSVPTTAQPSSSDNATSSANDGGASVQAATSSNINRKVTSNTNTQQFSSTKVNQLSINSTNEQNEHGLQTSLVQDTNNTDWTRNGYYQARASNVDFQLTDTGSQGSSEELADNVSVGFSETYHFGIKAHFTLQTADLKLNNRVYIGSIMLSNSLNDAAHNIAIIASSDPHNVGEFSYQGQYIGHIYVYQLDGSNADFFLKVEQANSFATPVIDIVNWSNKDIWGYNWASSPKYFVNVPNQFTENLMMPGGKTYHFNMYYDYHELNNWSSHSIQTIGTHDFNIYDYTYPVFAKNGTTPDQQLNSSDIAILNEKNGQGLVVPNTGYKMAYSYHPSVNTVYPMSFQIIWNAFVKDKDNKLTNESVLVYGPWVQYANVGNGYSLNELKNMCGGNAGIYSLQNDGTYLYYINLLPSALVMDRGLLINSLRSKSKIIAMQGDRALQNTLNLYYSQPFGGRSLQLLVPSFMASPSRYDSLSVDNVQLIDPTTSNVLSRYNWRNVPDTLQLSGKAAIRVHYINGYNGQQIGNSQTFNDDQGKTLSYQAQNSLGTGYSLRRSASHSLLNGQSLPSSYTLLDGSQKSSITYPKENMVSDVYYVIDPNPQQLVINYYDLSGKLVSSKTLSGYTDQRLSLSYLTPAGYVLAAQSQPASYQFGADHNELDFVVVPRVTVSMNSRIVTRTINIMRPDGSTYSVLQRVQFTRPQYTDTLTHVISYGSWAMPSRFFVEYCPDIVDGYTVKSVSALKVLPTDTDSVVSVKYVKNPTVSAPKYVDVFGHEYVVLPTGYHVVTGQNQNQTGILIAKDVTPATSQSVEYVTRTVTITLPNGRVRTIKQRVRKGTRFGRVAVPKLRGYKVVVTGDSQELGSTAAEKDIVMSVRFVKM